jgi:hypothetical protein
MNKELIMLRRFIASLLVALVSESVARADIPLPDHLKYADPEMTFGGIAEHPDYVFHLRFHTYNGNPDSTPYTVVEIPNSKPFPLKLQRRLGDMKLLAMKRTDFAKRAKDEKSLAWLTDKTEGVLAAEVEEPTTVVLKTAKKPPQATYKAQLKNGKLEVELVSRTKDPEANAGSVLPNSMAGLALAAGLASLGMLIVRRRKAGSA